MPDLSRDDINHANAPLAVASERQIWNNLSPEGRAQVLGQSIVGESNISNKESVYQKDPKIRSYESMDYSSLPQHVQYDVSQVLHEMGYFKETYGATTYEVDGDNRYECKDCEEPFVTEEDLRVHRKVNHDNDESETASQEAYNYSLNIDPSLTKDNLNWARKVIRGESSRQSYPQNDPPTKADPPLPKGRKEYDDNPNHYFYDNKLFRRGSRGNYYGQDGVALTEAKHLLNLEDKILDKFGWESTKDIETNKINRQVFASEVAKVVNVENLHPRTIKILDSVNKPFLVNTLQSLGAKWARETSDPPNPEDTPIEDIPYRGDVDDNAGTQDVEPFSQQGEPVLHQDYDPEHPHEHNAFDQNFGDKVAEEQQEEEKEKVYPDLETDKYKEYEWQKGQETDDEEEIEVKEVPHEPVQEPTQESDGRTCEKCGFYSADEQEMHNHVQDHVTDPEEAKEDFPFEEEDTTVTAEPDLLNNVNTDVLEIEGEQYDPEEEYNVKANEAQTISNYVGAIKKKGSESIQNILEDAIDVPVERESINETIYNRKLDGYHEDKIARELALNHDLDYDNAIEAVRAIEVSNDDRVAKTLYGKRVNQLTEVELDGMKTLAGEAKKKSTGDKNARR